MGLTRWLCSIMNARETRPTHCYHVLHIIISATKCSLSHARSRVYCSPKSLIGWAKEQFCPSRIITKYIFFKHEDIQTRVREGQCSHFEKHCRHFHPLVLIVIKDQHCYYLKTNFWKFGMVGISSTLSFFDLFSTMINFLSSLSTWFL